MEMLAIVETLKEFRTILYGTELHIHTDHANLTFKTATSQRVMRWRAYVEEYAPKLYYIAEAEEFSDILKDDNLFECFLSLPVMASPGNLITNTSETNSRLVKPWLLPVSGTLVTTSSKS